MIINDVEKAKEVLLDVGYYRLGFYWFPFEKPCGQSRSTTREETNQVGNISYRLEIKYTRYVLKFTSMRVMGITYTNIFENYLDVVRCVRNTCAHGGLLYDMALYPLIRPF